MGANGAAIFWLNLLMGWTALGWLAAFIWSLTAVRRDLIKPQVAATPPKLTADGQWRICPYCAEQIKPQAVLCRHCRRELS